jgi:hypothetical protein
MMGEIVVSARFRVISFVSLFFFVAACNSTSDDSAQIQPLDLDTGISIGSSCHSEDPTQTCLALKYVAYTDNDGDAVASKSNALAMLNTVNSIWIDCNIQFEIDEYVTVDPNKYALSFNPRNTGEMDDIRKAFQDKNTLLVVNTGKWDRTGTLGKTSANAWTAMPGSNPMGSVFEGTPSIIGFGNIYAHELGHYLDLDHVSITTDVMNPIIYSNSTSLTLNQCNIAKSTIATYWSAMVR